MLSAPVYLCPLCLYHLILVCRSPQAGWECWKLHRGGSGQAEASAVSPSKASLYLHKLLCCYNEFSMAFNHDCGAKVRLKLLLFKGYLLFFQEYLQSIHKVFLSLKQQGQRKSEELCSFCTENRPLTSKI